MTPLQKADVIAAVKHELQAQYDRIAAAAREAHGYATDPDSKAESKYDTRSLEASYLAEGQAAKAEELAQALRIFDGKAFASFDETDPIDLGALVEVRYPDRSRAAFLLAAKGGGVMTEIDGVTIMVVTTEAPIFERLSHRRKGDELEDPSMFIVQVS